MNQALIKWMVFLVVCTSTLWAQENLIQYDPQTLTTYIVNEAGERYAITGELHYPTPYVLTNLHLENWITEKERKYFTIDMPLKVTASSWGSNIPEKEQQSFMLDPKILKRKKGKVLSLGEGMSGFVPWVNQTLGISAVGIDLWYDENKIPTDSSQMKSYFESFRQYLIQDDATLLENVEGSYEVIVAHYLFRYIEKDSRLGMLKRCLDLLNNGGTLRFNTIDQIDFSELTSMLDELKVDYHFDYAVFQGTIRIELNNIEEFKTPYREIISKMFVLPTESLLPKEILPYYDSLDKNEGSKGWFKELLSKNLMSIPKNQMILVIRKK